MNTPTLGRLIVLEGIDGAGKSTHLPWIIETLRTLGHDVLQTREPGGTSLGESLRHLVLHEPMHVETELLLMFAARCEHWLSVIKPALLAGTWVVCDRFTPASYAYQGAGKGLKQHAINDLEVWLKQHTHATTNALTPDVKADLVFLFDLDPDLAENRRSSHASDKFEVESSAFFSRVREAYLRMAEQSPSAWQVLDARLPIHALQEHMYHTLQKLSHNLIDPT